MKPCVNNPVAKKAKLRRASFCAVAVLLFFVALIFSPTPFKKQGAFLGETVRASAAVGDAFAVNKYEVDVTVNADRTVSFHEKVLVKMLQSQGSQFYRSLPIDQGDGYFDIRASRSDGDVLIDDTFVVKENEDDSAYLDVICYGGITRGKEWTYDFYYTMRSSEKTADSLVLDVVGGGWTVALHNVCVNVTFPSAPLSYAVYSSAYGAAKNDYTTVTKTGENTLKITGETLPLCYNANAGDYSAAAVTLSFRLEPGAMRSYSKTILSSPIFYIALFVSIAAIGVAILLTAVFKRRYDMVTTVSVKPPKGMDPLRMGYVLDGTADNEDVTSMIYYFADQGYLTIELPENKKGDVVLHRTEKPISDDMPSWQRELMKGLFDDGEREDTEMNDLKEHFYASADKAKTLVAARRGAEYEKRSFIGAFILSLIAVGLYALLPLFTALTKIGGGYIYWKGALSFIPILLAFSGFFAVEKRRYKEKQSARAWKNVACVLLLAAFGVWYTAAFARHILTVYERLFVSIAATICAIFAARCVSRTEEYVKLLGEILGFKDFIVYTEEDKIKFMLEQNPQLYYDVLPYAQVLGVTKEWEEKFASITIRPPEWCSGADMTLFDYMLLNSMLRASFATAMIRPQSHGGGTFLGGGGSGGGFGGFSGGGHGGGGGGIR